MMASERSNARKDKQTGEGKWIGFNKIIIENNGNGRGMTGRGGGKWSPVSFSPVTSTNAGINH